MSYMVLKLDPFLLSSCIVWPLLSLHGIYCYQEDLKLKCLSTMPLFLCLQTKPWFLWIQTLLCYLQHNTQWPNRFLSFFHARTTSNYWCSCLSVGKDFGPSKNRNVMNSIRHFITPFYICPSIANYFFFWSQQGQFKLLRNFTVNI